MVLCEIFVGKLVKMFEYIAMIQIVVLKKEAF